MRRKFIVGNWKMNGHITSLHEAQAIEKAAHAHAGVDVALCPPFTLVMAMAKLCPQLCVGGQDCHMIDKGAFTGSVSADMLADCGAKLAIVGHSERREYSHESSEMVRNKASAALGAGLDVIICVGEALSIREAGDAEAFVLDQVAQSLPMALINAPKRIAIAYEPIWAIGTGLTASTAEIAAMHDAIRGVLGSAADDVRILYGGSVTPDNAAEILATSNVDGALVGGASLSAAKFVPIIGAGQVVSNT